MLFNVSGLMLEGTGATRSHEVSGQLHTSGRPPERLKGKIGLLRTPRGILVQARIDLSDPENCSRCLEPLEETLHIEFNEEFRASHDPRTGLPMEDEGLDDEEFVISDQHILDLTEAVRQYREASAEMKPLCRSDCRGLCPRCGANLNEGDCSCDRTAVDSRWAKLSALRGADLDGKE